MTSTRFSFKKSLLQRTAVAGALVVLCASASAALAPFTLTPSGVGLKGAQFTADNILISDYATVRFGDGNSFTETGFLAISGVESGGNILSPSGLNTSTSTGYGMYIKFTGAGSTSGGNPSTGFTSGTFNSLSYELYGYNGAPATFGFDASNTPTQNASGAVLLANGSLVPGTGTVQTAPANDGAGGFRPSAGAQLTFAAASGTSGFFTTPAPFYTLAVASFTNTATQVTRFNTDAGAGFKISQGGGSFNFITTPVPEPETYALMLAGLFAVGFVARRRRSV